MRLAAMGVLGFGRGFPLHGDFILEGNIRLRLRLMRHGHLRGSGFLRRGFFCGRGLRCRLAVRMGCHFMSAFSGTHEAADNRPANHAAGRAESDTQHQGRHNAAGGKAGDGEAYARHDTDKRADGVTLGRAVKQPFREAVGSVDNIFCGIRYGRENTHNECILGGYTLKSS